MPLRKTWPARDDAQKATGDIDLEQPPEPPFVTSYLLYLLAVVSDRVNLPRHARAARWRGDARTHEARILATPVAEGARRSKALLVMLLDQPDTPEGGSPSMSRHSGTGVSGAPSAK